jgi:hypothetical protein
VSALLSTPLSELPAQGLLLVLLPVAATRLLLPEIEE